MARDFQGKIELDVRDSVADWDAYRASTPPQGAPNVLVVLYDDTGMAAWSPYGGRINMPTMDRLAQNGLTYSQWHTTALCSPTRSTFLTGRNHPSTASPRSPSRRRVSGLQLPHPGVERHHGSRAPRCRMVDVLGRQEPQRADRRVDRRRLEEALAAGTGLRPVLRLHRRRDQQLVSVTGRGQPLHRSAVPPRAGLPPVEGPRRSGAHDDPRRQADGAGQALVPLVLPRGQPRSPSRAAGVHRQVQGSVRRRLRGLPRLGSRQDGREGHRSGRHRPDRTEPDGRRHFQPDR